MNNLPPQDRRPVTSPEWLGKYQVGAPLGSGGTATVYRARDPALDVDRAIKVLYREAALDWALRERFLAEARTLTGLVHPNVLRVYDVGDDEERCWYVMELVDGGTAQARIDEGGPLPAADALDVVFQILQALSAVHHMGIVHRDVKPNNILLSVTGRALLGDFGSQRMQILSPLTRTGDVLETLGYMGPEQRSDARYAGVPADIYAVGATLFGLTMGRAPLGLFEGQIDAAFLEAMPAPVREVIRTATRYKPELRYADARAMAVEVAAAADAILGLEGDDACQLRWMARFDSLLEAARVRALPGAMSLPPKARPEPPPGCGGVWEGRMSGLVPMEFELDANTSGEIVGWAITTGLRGQVVTKVEGRQDGANISLTEITQRPDAGRYTAQIAGSQLDGHFHSKDPSSPLRPFSLTRRVR